MWRRGDATPRLGPFPGCKTEVFLLPSCLVRMFICGDELPGVGESSLNECF